MAQGTGDDPMRLHCEFSTPVARTEVDDYVRHLVITIEAFGKDYELVVVGKLAMDQILWNDALADGVPLFDICDNDSQGLHEAHVILTNGHDSFRPDLGIKEATNHVMFLYGAVFHPSIHAYRQGILDTAFNLFGEESVALMWLETSGLPESELAELGFKRIAGESLIFRHSALRTPFGDRHPQGQYADMEALPEYEEWVLKEWEQFRDVAEE
jgi:hypothetical protein